MPCPWINKSGSDSEGLILNSEFRMNTPQPVIHPELIQKLSFWTEMINLGDENNRCQTYRKAYVTGCFG